MSLTRGQQRCVDTLDRPLVVAAGAGSGKTFTLTQRIVNALQTGYLNDIDEVCAITFTNRAAAELKSRIKAELRACSMVDQALKVDEAWVSTIHGMCARVLRAHALELGIDPSFEVADNVVASELMERAVDDVLAEAQADSSERLDALFHEYPTQSGGYGASVGGMVSSLVSAASSNARGTDAFVMPGATAPVPIAVEQALDVVDELIAAAAGEKESQKRDEWMATTQDQVDVARAALESDFASPVEALEALAPIKLAKTFGSKGYKAKADEARGEFAALVMELRLGAAAVHLETLVELARRALDAYGELKRQRGVLDNNDLLVMAAHAIEDHPGIAARYCDKFKLVMVDEFQDTDQMQVDMIGRLAGEGARRLCVVGDAQQSIYRFRGADVSVYRRHLSAVRSEWPDGVIQLADNFRSHPDVLAFVDRVFGMPDMFGGEFMSLTAGREEKGAAKPFDPSCERVIVQQVSVPWRGVSSDFLTRCAAARIADEFERMIGQGRSAGEMVVLLGRMANAGAYAQALRDRGISCVISGGSVFAGTPEAQLVDELVRVLANPAQTQSLFNVLTGPIFALTAADLLQVGGLEGFVRACRDDDAKGSARLVCALRAMGRAWRDVTRLPVSHVLEHIAVDSGWLTRQESEGAEGLASAANVLKAIRMVADVERAGTFGPATVAARFAETLAESKEAPGALSVSGGDSVRIMTIHASKGLEFPVVAVAELPEDRAPSSKLLVSSVAGDIYLSLDLARSVDDPSQRIDQATMAQATAYVLGDRAGEEELAQAVEEDGGALHRRLALREYLAEGDREEAKRLLYVAITRAKEAFVISMKGRRTKDNPTAIPKSALAGVAAALLNGDRCEYGGTLPAAYHHYALTPEDEQECRGADPATVPDGAQLSDAQNAPHLFMVPSVEDTTLPMPETYKPLHQGIFSYSSIFDASHEGNILGKLADAHFDDCDEALQTDLPEQSLPMPAAPFFDDFWDVDPSAAFDEDRATDLGTAFHRLAQYAVVTRSPGELLPYPPAKRIASLARTCNLDALQQDRLTRALARWFNSDLAAHMATFANLSAEVPFFVSVGQDAYLEGEIDLLALSDDGLRAVVVDYKTGGRDDETLEELREKHVLQASCYAYAIMLQGVEEVEAVFVRVERPCVDKPAQPQCVRYHFTSEDLPELERSIAEVYSRIQTQR